MSAPIVPWMGGKRRLADRIFGGDKEARLVYENIPSVVFSHPTIGAVGLTEPEARAKFGDDAIKIYNSTFVDLYYSMMEQEGKVQVLGEGARRSKRKKT